MAHLNSTQSELSRNAGQIGLRRLASRMNTHNVLLAELMASDETQKMLPFSIDYVGTLLRSVLGETSYSKAIDELELEDGASVLNYYQSILEKAADDMGIDIEALYESLKPPMSGDGWKVSVSKTP